MIKIKKGLDIPIAGAPVQIIEEGPTIHHVALLGEEYVGMRPSMLIQEGDWVKKGQALFEDKKNPGVMFTAPASGKVSAINRGERRVLQSVVIEIDGDEQVPFEHYEESSLNQLSDEQVQRHLLASGLWTALRTRPFSKTPVPNSRPRAIFVSAMDTQPLAADPQVIIATESDAFNHGLTILARLTEGKVHVCHAPGQAVASYQNAQVTYNEFSGPHPAGLVGTHIHFLEPVSLNKTVWHVGYQDVIAIGKLFTRGVDRSYRLTGRAAGGAAGFTANSPWGQFI